MHTLPVMSSSSGTGPITWKRYVMAVSSMPSASVVSEPPRKVTYAKRPFALAT